MGQPSRSRGRKRPLRPEPIPAVDHNLLGNPRYPDTRDSATGLQRRKGVNDSLKTHFVAGEIRFVDNPPRRNAATRGLSRLPKKARGQLLSENKFGLPRKCGMLPARPDFPAITNSCTDHSKETLFSDEGRISNHDKSRDLALVQGWEQPR